GRGMAREGRFGGARWHGDQPDIPGPFFQWQDRLPLDARHCLGREVKQPADLQDARRRTNGCLDYEMSARHDSPSCWKRWSKDNCWGSSWHSTSTRYFSDRVGSSTSATPEPFADSASESHNDCSAFESVSAILLSSSR